MKKPTPDLEGTANVLHVLGRGFCRFAQDLPKDLSETERAALIRAAEVLIAGVAALAQREGR